MGKTLNFKMNNDDASLTSLQNRYRRWANAHRGDMSRKRAVENARKGLLPHALVQPKESPGSNLRIPVE